MVKEQLPIPHAIAIAGGRDHELPKYARKLLNFLIKFFNIKIANIDIEMHRK